MSDDMGAIEPCAVGRGSASAGAGGRGGELSSVTDVGAIRGNPRLASAIRVLGWWDCAVVAAVVLAWGVVVFRGGADVIVAALIACGASVLIVFSAWYGLYRGARASMDSMMGWVAGAFLVRVLIVGAAVVCASQVELHARVIAWTIVATLVLHTGAEIWILSRTRVVNVVPVNNG